MKNTLLPWLATSAFYLMAMPAWSQNEYDFFVADGVEDNLVIDQNSDFIVRFNFTNYISEDLEVVLGADHTLNNKNLVNLFRAIVFESKLNKSIGIEGASIKELTHSQITINFSGNTQEDSITFVGSGFEKLFQALSQETCSKQNSNAA